MIINELVQKVSEMYRKQSKTIGLLKKSLDETLTELNEIENGKEVSLKQYRELVEKRNLLEKEIPINESYGKGLSDVREMLMDLGFETVITDGCNLKKTCKECHPPVSMCNKP